MRPLLAAALCALIACGGDDDAPGEPDAAAGGDVCDIADGTGVSFDPEATLCDNLSSYRFFTDLPGQVPNDGVVAYDLSSPLFSDYAAKYRFVYVPDGMSMAWHDTESFAMPEGAVLIKTFSQLADLRDPSAGEQLLETRLLFHAADGWDVITYVWNDEQTDAVKKIAGDTIATSWIHTDGSERTNDYSVPNTNQCKNCHEELDDVVGPIGPKARHLNRDNDYGDGPENQLQHLIDVGYLTGAPADSADWPAAAVWDDEATGTVDERARAWLDINCAHCHNPRGAARTSGLDLLVSQDNPFDYGVCKPPVAAGAGSGGFQYNIVPGEPDESIMVFRLESTEPDILMPELGRKLVHEEAVALIRAWIAAMPGDCGTP